MSDTPDALDCMFDLAPRLLAATKSLVQFLGPFRNYHPEWRPLADEARTNLGQCDAAKVRRMDRASARLKNHEIAYHQLRHDRDQLEREQITTQADHELPLLDELRRLGLLELRDDTGELGPTLKLHDLEAAMQVALALESKAAGDYRASKRLAIRCERMARPALKAAEEAAAIAWVNEQVAQLRGQHAAAAAFVTDYAQVLPGLVDLEGQIICNETYSSACAALCDVTADLIAASTECRTDGRLARLQTVDYEDLGLKVQHELAALRRQTLKPPELRHAAASIDFALQRILIAAEGERLGFTQIFERVKNDPKTAELFPMATINRDHEKRICALAGRQTKDGWIILANEGGRGVRREFWAERRPS